MRKLMTKSASDTLSQPSQNRSAKDTTPKKSLLKSKKANRQDSMSQSSKEISFGSPVTSYVCICGMNFYITWKNEREGCDQHGTRWINKDNPACTDPRE